MSKCCDVCPHVPECRDETPEVLCRACGGDQTVCGHSQPISSDEIPLWTRGWEAGYRVRKVPSEAEVSAVVERVLCSEGWVCNPADHETIPEPGECINCDGERHRTGYRVYAAMVEDGYLPGAPS